MEIVRIPVRQINSENLKAEHLAYISTVNSCPLCGKQLHFVHGIDDRRNSIREEAFCQSCGIQIKTQEFQLQ